MTANSSTIRTSKASKLVIDDVLVLRMTNATLAAAANEHEWGDSDSGTYSNRIGTRRGCTGTITVKFDENQKLYSVVRELQISKLVLWENASDYWVLPCALIQNIDETIDTDSKDPIELSFGYGNDGIYYAPGESGAPVQSLPS